VALPPTLPTEQFSGDSAVVSLLALEETTPVGVPKLEDAELRERYANGLTTRRGDLDPVERGLVGVEGEQRARLERLGNRPLQEQDGPVPGDVQLLDPDIGSLEDRAVIRCEEEKERGPLTVAKRKSNLSRGKVKVEGLGIGPQELPSDVGNAAPSALPESRPVRLGEGEGDLGGDDGMLAGDSVHEGPVPGEAREGASGGLAGE
jgi:hypothetical protein